MTALPAGGDIFTIVGEHGNDKYRVDTRSYSASARERAGMSPTQASSKSSGRSSTIWVFGFQFCSVGSRVGKGTACVVTSGFSDVRAWCRRAFVWRTVVKSKASECIKLLSAVVALVAHERVTDSLRL
jgi:hypothetical protein